MFIFNFDFLLFFLGADKLLVVETISMSFKLPSVVRKLMLIIFGNMSVYTNEMKVSIVAMAVGLLPVPHVT